MEVLPGVGQKGGGRCDSTALIYDWSGVGPGCEIRSVILKDYSLVGRLGVLALRERLCSLWAVWHLRSSLDNPGGDFQKSVKEVVKLGGGVGRCCEGDSKPGEVSI